MGAFLLFNRHLSKAVKVKFRHVERWNDPVHIVQIIELQY